MRRMNSWTLAWKSSSRSYRFCATAASGAHAGQSSYRAAGPAGPKGRTVLRRYLVSFCTYCWM